jgi:DNA-binding response OmpR family regulator
MATILIMDDEEAILGFLKERLMYEGFNVLIATDGIEGMKLFNDNQIDLVITDIIMPRKDGIETIIEMKGICPDIKIIAMSGGGRNKPEGYLVTAKQAGAKYIFAKPFKTSDLVTAVYELLEEEKVSQCFSNSVL